MFRMNSALSLKGGLHHTGQPEMSCVLPFYFVDRKNGHWEFEPRMSLQMPSL